MAQRLISLRYAGLCRQCAASLPAKSKAWWDDGPKTVTCLACYESSGVVAATSDVAEPPDSGVAGASARKEYERRKTKREAAIDAKWGRFAGVVKFLTEEPQSTRAWARGASGEERLATVLHARLTDRAIPLHDRKVPGTRGNIDHLVIAPTGIWIIDAKAFRGRVQRRDVGGWFRTDLRLYVGGRDRTKAVQGLTWQRKAVTEVLGSDEVSVSQVLCFTDAEWGVFDKPFTLDGVLCTYPRALAESINGPGPLTPEQVVDFAQRLATAFPATHARPSSPGDEQPEP